MHDPVTHVEKLAKVVHDNFKEDEGLYAVFDLLFLTVTLGDVMGLSQNQLEDLLERTITKVNEYKVRKVH